MSEWYARERHALEVERDELRQDLDLLLGAVQDLKHAHRHRGGLNMPTKERITEEVEARQKFNEVAEELERKRRAAK